MADININLSLTTTDVPEGDNLYFSSSRVHSSISGTTDRITVSSGVIDIASTYIGQTSISTLGVVDTGTLANGIKVLLGEDLEGDIHYIDADGFLRRSDSINFDNNRFIVGKPTYIGAIGFTPTAFLHLAEGQPSAESAPLKFTSGRPMDEPEVGAMEYFRDELYFTIESGASRKLITLNEGLTSGRIPYATALGTLLDSPNLTFDPGLIDSMVVRGFAGGGFKIGSYNINTGALWSSTTASPSTSNYFIACDGSDTKINIPTTGKRIYFAHLDTIIGSINSTGGMYIGGSTLATAGLHLRAGTATASTAPLKFTTGVLMATAEIGAIEYNTDDLYVTITSGAARKKITLNEGLTLGRVAFAGVGGRLTDNSLFQFITATARMGIGISPVTRLHIHETAANNAATITLVNAATARTSTIASLSLVNTNTTNNNWNRFEFTDVVNGTASAGLFCKYINHTTKAGQLEIVTHNGTGLNTGVIIDSEGKVGVQIQPTAVMHLKAGTATAGTAPLKFESGTNLTTVENGTMEFDGTNLYFTVGGVRKTVVLV